MAFGGHSQNKWGKEVPYLSNDPPPPRQSSGLGELAVTSQLLENFLSQGTFFSSQEERSLEHSHVLYKAAAQPRSRLPGTVLCWWLWSAVVRAEEGLQVGFQQGLAKWRFVQNVLALSSSLLTQRMTRVFYLIH